MNAVVADRALSRRDAVLLIVVAGSLWGLSEVVLGAGMRAVLPEIRAAALVAVGALLMGAVVGFGGRAAWLPAIAAIAVAGRQLVVPLLGASLLCKANACLAVMLQGGAMAGFVILMGRRIHGRAANRAMAAGAAAATSAAAFWALGLQLAPCAYLLSFDRPGGGLAFMGKEGLMWAAMSSLAMPAGYRWGARMAESALSVRARRPRLVYALSAIMALGCWVATWFATAHGY